MSDAKYVYREVSGKELEKATVDGWEFYGAGAENAQFGSIGVYLVRRPLEMPEAMKLIQDLEEAEDALAKSQQARDVLAASLARVQEAVVAHAAMAVQTGRDKPTRDDLVRRAKQLSYIVTTTR